MVTKMQLCEGHRISLNMIPNWREDKEWDGCDSDETKCKRGCPLEDA